MDLKGTLRAITLELRHELEGKFDTQGNWQPGDLERRLAAIGVRRDRAPVPVAELPHLSSEDQEARRVVDAFLQSRAETAQSRDAAITEFLRNAAYTWANRLLALRCMEARALIDEVVLQKDAYNGRSLQHNRLAKKQPERCAGTDEGLFAALFDEFSRRAEELPLLFDPEALEVALRPSVAALKRCVALLSGMFAGKGQEVATDEVFSAPDALGWTYQYWNAEEKARVFAKIRTKRGFKIEGAEIIPATCIYTEPYMVKFLVQNSLGAIWMGMYPGSRLFEKWEYYLRDADRASMSIKKVSEITFLDPACGSGHFLIDAFELFYSMYIEEGILTEPAQICASILERNLYGIDIDERAVQIAAVALVMKAKEKAREFAPRSVNLVATNIRLPAGKEYLDEFLRKHPEDAPLKPALLAIFEGLAHADELGSLLQIEEPVDRELQYLRDQQLARERKAGAGTLFGPHGAEEWSTWKHAVIDRLRQHFSADTRNADLPAAFFGNAASKALSLVDLLANHYDVVAANPPFMGSKSMAPSIKKFVAKTYRAGKRDLLAAFIQRALQLVLPESGAVAVVSQQTILLLKSYAELRGSTEVGGLGLVRATTIDSVVQLGPGAFGDVGGVVVSPILVVFRSHSPNPSHYVCAIRTLDCPDPESKSAALMRRCRISNAAERYQPRQRGFLGLDRTPILFWVPDAILDLFQNKPILRQFARARQGICTTNNGRFIRFGWEVDTRQSRFRDRWFLASKGGGYRKWCGFENHFLEWQLTGTRVKQFQEETPGAIHWSGRMPSEDYFFRSGWTYSLVAPVIGARLLNERSLFLDTAPVVIPHETDRNGLFGAILNSRIASYLVRALTQDAKIREGYLQRIPWPDEHKQLSLVSLAAPLVRACLALKDVILAGQLTERSFGQEHYSTFSAWICAHELAAAVLHSLEGALETIAVEAYELSNTAMEGVTRQMGTPVGWYPLLSGYDHLPEMPFAFESSVMEALTSIIGQPRLQIGPDELDALKGRLHEVYESSHVVTTDADMAAEQADAGDEDESDADEVVGSAFSSPNETGLEIASAALRVHPISIYWLLREGFETDRWRFRELERQFCADRITDLVLRQLGHRWSRGIEADGPPPMGGDENGVIAITEGAGEPRLLARIRDRLTQDVGHDRVGAVEREFEEIVGRPLGVWLASDFFKRHISQFRKRPIALQIVSNERRRGRNAGQNTPAFSCLVYYHSLDTDLLPKLRTQYVGPLRTRLQSELGSLEKVKDRSAEQDARRLDLVEKLEELKAFDARLEHVIVEGFASPTLDALAATEPLDKWTSRDGRTHAVGMQDAFLAQERRYDPDLNDGVRVNIAPLQRAGLLAADVLAAKDVEKAIADRAEWRADERRWCREGKLPQPGWWAMEATVDASAWPDVVPALDPAQEAAVSIWALLHASNGTIPRLELARAFALRSRPDLLVRLAPPALRNAAQGWALKVGQRKVGAGLFAETIKVLAERGGIGLDVDAASRSIVTTSAHTPSMDRVDPWFLSEAGLALRVLAALPSPQVQEVDSSIGTEDLPLILGGLA